MKEIGGYFGLDLGDGDACLHAEAPYALASGRSCLRLLAEALQPATVWLPFYRCRALVEALTPAGVTPAFYPLDEHLEIAGGAPSLGPQDRLLYINYFGLKTRYAATLAARYGSRLWLDHAQDFFFKPRHSSTFHFNSARKFFGVPDGAYLYAPPTATLPAAGTLPRNTRYTTAHLMLRLQGKTEAGLPYFQQNEMLLGDSVTRLSSLSEALLATIDYDRAARLRRSNYQALHRALSDRNLLSTSVLNLSPDEVPFCYPFLPRRPIAHAACWAQKLYVPFFWNACRDDPADGFGWEKKLATELLPLPIDHRYGEAEMARLVSIIEALAR